jgi:hypothetical protein
MESWTIELKGFVCIAEARMRWLGAARIYLTTRLLVAVSTTLKKVPHLVKECVTKTNEIEYLKRSMVLATNVF